MNKFMDDKNGFTLIELLIAIALFGIVSGVMLTILSSIQTSYTTHSRSVDLRQNLRASLDFMAEELMSAGSSGYDFTNLTMGTANAGIVSANRDSIRFTADLDMDGSFITYGEDITYSLEAGSDTDNDGIANASPGSAALVRTPSGLAPETMMDDVQAVQFAYAFDDNVDNQLDFTDTNSNGVQDVGEPTIWAYDNGGTGLLNTQVDGTLLALPISFTKIRLVRIWLLGRTSSTLKKSLDNNTYNLGSINVSGNNDFYKRILLSTTVNCRNMGL